MNVSFAVNPFESFFSYHYNAVLTVHDARGNSSQDVADIYILPVNQESCFLAGTKVAMADGSYRNIEDVKVGDLVKIYDLEKRRIVAGMVTKVFHHSKDEMGDYYVVINDFLKVTPNHLLMTDKGWLPAGMINVGDKLTDGVNEIDIASVEKVYERVPTYDLEVEGTHNYIVSLCDENIVSHNYGSQNATRIIRTKPVYGDVAVLKLEYVLYDPSHHTVSKPPGGGGCGGGDECRGTSSGKTYTGVTGGFYYDNPSYVYYYPPRLPSSGINQLSAFGIHAISLPQNTRYVIHISSYEIENRTYNYTSKIELIGDDSNYGLVDGKKIEALKSLDYNKAKEALGIGNYDFNITIVAFNGTTILSYGKDYSEASTLASYSRSVTIYPDTRAYMIVRVFK
ncbi:MAG: hypothetical protein FE041_01575 [Thermoplasmata archaeon]|nr:MAG: hypothetical protein FE041_01575 [Thermoplasmata archaeon]